MPQNIAITPVNGQANNRANNIEKNVDVSQLKSLNLFGTYIEKRINDKNQQASQEIQEAPQTKLNLSLSGVVASSNVDVATAVIENKGQQNTYGINDKIEGTRAILEKVLFDRVIIKHSGKFETLMLDGIKFNKASTQPQQSRQKTKPRETKRFVDNRNNTNLSSQANGFRDAVTKDPGKITDYLRISPKMKNGATVGYLLMPGKDPEFFKSSGLQSGDVAVQMNGYDLTSPIDAAQALQALKTEPEVALWVDRNGEVTEILFSIEN